MNPTQPGAITKAWPRWTMIVLVILLVQVALGAVVMHFLRPPYNPGFKEFPAMTILHVVLGGVFVLLAPFQFVASIRKRWMSYHRWAGRLLVLIGVIVGLTAVFLAVVVPFSGNPERLINGFFGVLFLACIWKGMTAIWRHDVRTHRRWMTRTLAMGLAPATMRILFIPAVIILKPEPSDVTTLATLSIISFSVAFPLHLLIAEIWIRSQQGAPAT